MTKMQPSSVRVPSPRVVRSQNLRSGRERARFKQWAALQRRTTQGLAINQKPGLALQSTISYEKPALAGSDQFTPGLQNKVLTKIRPVLMIRILDPLIRVYGVRQLELRLPFRPINHTHVLVDVDRILRPPLRQLVKVNALSVHRPIRSPRQTPEDKAKAVCTSRR